MTLEAQINGLATRVGTEAKALRTLLNGNAADLASLTTTNKANIVGALNEVKALAEAAAGGGAAIVDTATATTSAWSSQKITDEISGQLATLVGGATAALDTFAEVEAALTSGDTAVAALTTSVGNKVDFATAQTLTAAQKTQALENIGAQAAADIGDTDRNFVTVFETAIA